MRTWSRSRITERCGLCTGLIEPSHPLLRITVPGVKRQLVRCVSCVPGGAPPDLPQLVERAEPGPLSMQPLRRLAFDFKRQAAGE